MLVINIEDSFLPEKTYLIDLVFNEFLGVNYEVKASTRKDYDVVFGKKKIEKT